jgi:hypothetical protein
MLSRHSAVYRNVVLGSSLIVYVLAYDLRLWEFGEHNQEMRAATWLNLNYCEASLLVLN